MYQNPKEIIAPAAAAPISEHEKPQMRVINGFTVGSFLNGRAKTCPSLHFLGAGQTVAESSSDEGLQSFDSGPFHILNLRHQGESPVGPAGRGKLYVDSYLNYADDVNVGFQDLCGDFLKNYPDQKIQVSGFSTGAMALLVAMTTSTIQDNIDHAILFSPLIEVSVFGGLKGKVLKPYSKWKSDSDPTGFAMDPFTKLKLTLLRKDASSIPAALGIHNERPWPTYGWVQQTLQGGEHIRQNIHKLKTPMLWIFAEKDPILNSKASIRIANQINRISFSETGKELIKLVCLPSRDHNMLAQKSQQSQRVRHEIRKFRYERAQRLL